MDGDCREVMSPITLNWYRVEEDNKYVTLGGGKHGFIVIPVVDMATFREMLEEYWRMHDAREAQACRRDVDEPDSVLPHL